MKAIAGRPSAYAAILVLAVLLTLPAALTPPRLYDSFWIDWVWVDQFTAELHRGTLYPRWLPLSHGGLGSPVFYYYPPLAFYLTGILGLAGLSTYASIVGAFGFGFALSGAAMYHWLKDWAKLPLAGALFYMAAPYHLVDFYGRGALAEFLAIGFIPLLALGMRRLPEGRGFVLTPLAYAALIATHLPLALLTSLFLVAPYALYLARRRPRLLLSFAPPLALGISLAAIYLVPALALEPYRDAASLWTHPSLKAENWSLLAWNVPGPPIGMRIAVAAILVGLALPSLFIAVRDRSVWAVYAGLCCVLGAGLIPGAWSLPLLGDVQFPFRMLPLAEFGLATALALLPRLSPLLMVPPLAVSAWALTLSPPKPEWPSLQALAADHPDVPENLPPGTREYSWPSRWALEVAKAHRAPVQRGQVTTEPVFYFPAWQVQCPGGPAEAFPDRETQLLSYRGSGCSRLLGWTRPETAGALVSAGALLILLLLLANRWRKSAG